MQNSILQESIHLWHFKMIKLVLSKSKIFCFWYYLHTKTSNRRTQNHSLLQMLSNSHWHYKPCKWSTELFKSIPPRGMVLEARLCFSDDLVESIFSSLFVLAGYSIHRNAIVYCNLTLITVIFFLVSPKQSSKKYSSNGMQQWILNCLQATQAVHKNIIKKKMPFVLITSKLHKLKCLNISNAL